jgi:hypothetical protein
VRSRSPSHRDRPRQLVPVLDTDTTARDVLDTERDFRRWLANTVLEAAVGSGIKSKDLSDDLLLAAGLPLDEQL